jgi:glycosyltransferase involved in cell wall biosynthesis
MKIAIILSNTKDPSTGTAAVSWNLKLEFERAGHECELIFKEDITPFAKGVLGQFLFAFMLPFKRRLDQFDVLDINAGDGLIAWLYFRYFRRKRPLFVARSHGLEHVGHEARVAEAHAGRARLSWKYPIYHGGYRLRQVAQYLKVADLVLLLNNYDRDYAIRRLGVRRERIIVVDNGVPKAFLCRRVDFEPPSRIRMALLGGFIPRKGIAYSVPALDRLLKKNVGLEVGFLGVGVSSSEVHDGFDQSVRGRIIVIEKYKNTDIPEILQDYHILLFASLSEGFPLAPLECMACGLAAIVSDIPGIAERLKDGRDSILVPPRNQSAIEAAVQRLIDDPGLLKSLRENGYQFAQNYSWERIASRTLDLYQAAIAARARNMQM